MISRRSFISSIFAMTAAPAIVKADSLMKIVVPSKDIWIPGAIWVNPTRMVFSYYIKTVEQQWVRVVKEGDSFADLGTTSPPGSIYHQLEMYQTATPYQPVSYQS